MAIIRAPKKSKWYVVWIGRIPGIYPSWEKCREQVEGFPGSRYRAYDTLADARTAVDAGPPKAGGSRVDESLAKGGAGKKSAKVKKTKETNNTKCFRGRGMQHGYTGNGISGC